MIKISVIIPTYNEENSIGRLLTNLINQSLKPDEIIISDGGSNDKTLDIVANFKDESIKIINRNGTCRGSGRNSGINQAKNEYIALIDAGSYPNKNWLEELYLPFQNNQKLKIVYGSVRPESNNIIKKSLSSIIISKNNYEGFISPSVCSLLYKKDISNFIKFPESIDGNYVAEDLIFIEKIEKNKILKATNLKAVVNWEISSNLFSIFLRFENLSRGGIKSGFMETWHYGLFRNIIILSIFVLFLLIFNLNLNLLFLIPLIILIRANSYNKYTKKIFKNNFLQNIAQLFYTSLLLMIIDLATFFGFLKWIFIDNMKKNNLRS